MERKKDWLKPAIMLSVAMYMAGFVGLNNHSISGYFRFFTPFHLLFNLFLLFYFQENKNKWFYFYCLVILGAGFAIEVLGVQTGIIFGNYFYGATLGVKMFKVPLLIGANWLILVLCAGSIAQHFLSTIKAEKLNYLILKVLIAATLMTALDFFIEPVAGLHDFWHWHHHIIPFQNYLAWFIISFSMLVLFFLFPFNKINLISLALYLMQLIFFMANWFFL